MTSSLEPSPNKKASRVLDKKCLEKTSPEPLVKIRNNFAELFLMIFSTGIAQMVLLHRTKKASRVLDKKCLEKTSPKPLVQIVK